MNRLGWKWRIGLLIGLCLGGFNLTGAQTESRPAPQAVFAALVTRDSSQAALNYGLLGDPVTALAYAENVSTPSNGLQRQTIEWALGLKRWSLAQRLLTVRLEAGTDEAWAHHQLGLLTAMNDKRAALAHLQAAWGMDETYAEAELIATLTDNTDSRALAFQVGTTLADRGYYALAERAFTESAIFAASPAESLASVGLMRALQGLDYVPWLTHAQTLAPQSPEVYTLTGLSHRAAGYFVDSLNALLVALNLAPLDPEINAQVAEAYSVIGDEQSAAFWYGQAVLLSDTPRYRQAYDAARTAIPPLPTLAP